MQIIIEALINVQILLVDTYLSIMHHEAVSIEAFFPVHVTGTEKCRRGHTLHCKELIEMRQSHSKDNVYFTGAKKKCAKLICKRKTGS